MFSPGGETGPSGFLEMGFPPSLPPSSPGWTGRGGRGVHPPSAGTPCWGERSACAGMVAPGLGADRAAGVAAEQFLFGPLLETTRELGQGGRRAERRNCRKSGVPLENTACWGAGRRACPGRGLHGQTRSVRKQVAARTLLWGRTEGGWLKVCTRLNLGGLPGRGGEKW